MLLQEDQGNVIMYFFCVHYKRDWFFLPAEFIPSAAKNENDFREHYFEVLDDPELSEEESFFQPKRNCDRAVAKILKNVDKCLIPKTMTLPELRGICSTNDIPINWVTDRLVVGCSPKKCKSRVAKRKIRGLSESEFENVVAQFNKKDSKIALALKLLWYLNGQITQGGGYITIEEILRLKALDVTSKGEFSKTVSLSRRGRFSTQLATLWIPDILWDGLDALIDEDTYYVFATKRGIPITTAHVNRKLATISKKLGYVEHLTSLSFRPEIYLYEKISSGLWKKLTNDVPRLISCRGRNPNHDPRQILNAILYHFHTGCSWRKLPATFPPYTAVESQLRRWKSSGVWATLISLGIVPKPEN